MSAAKLDMGWRRPENRDRLLQVVADRDNMHDTHAERLASARQGECDLLARGQSVKRVMVDADEFAETRSAAKCKAFARCRWAG